MFRLISSIVLFLLISSTAAFSRSDDFEEDIFLGVSGISDWSTQHPFIDLMKSARPWIGHLPNQWGGMSFDDLRDHGILDTMGWPTTVPAAVTKLETLILTDQPEGATQLAGRYHVVFDGSGELDVSGRGRIVESGAGKLIFSYHPGPGSVGIAIKSTESSDPIRNIRVYKEEHANLFQQGGRFNPQWVARLGHVETIRFMAWMNTNDTKEKTFEDMPAEDDFSFAWRGVPLSTMVALANEIGANPWFTLPHMADDEFMRSFAETVFDTLDPELLAYVEYSNEVWNFIFQQADWALKQAKDAWGDVGDGWMQFYGLRAAQVMDIWTEVFGAASEDRLKRIVSVHTGWPELERAILYGDLAVSALGDDPAAHFDAYAVTGYFGYELGKPEATQHLLDQAHERAESDGKAKGLSRVALREYVKQNKFKQAYEPAAEIVKNGSLRELVEYLWPYHAKAAREAGLELIMYEGGTHAAPIGDAINDSRLVEFLSDFNYSVEMGALYTLAIGAWRGVSKQPFNAFVDVAPPSKWGSWGALRHLSDENPRWDALRASSPDAAK